MYDCFRDVEFRLRGTVVMYKGDYDYVEDCSEGMGGNYFVHLTKAEKKVNIKSKHLTIRRIPTGYLNVQGKLQFFERIPRRAYRQGLRHDNLNFIKGHWDYLKAYARGRVDERKLEGDVKILNRDYCVKGNKLYFRERLVGVYLKDAAYLNNDNKFLIESLEASLNE